MRDARLGENKGGTSNSGCSNPFSPFAVTAVKQGVEERQLQQGGWQRERHFPLTLAVRAFPSVTGSPLKSSVTSSHLGAGQGLRPGSLASCSSRVCARNPAQTLQPRRDLSRAVGTSPAKPLPHSTLRAHKWEKLVMRRGKHRD